MVADVLRAPDSPKRIKNFSAFRQKNLPITKQSFHSSKELEAIGDEYDFYICGSDQIWNPQITAGVDPAFFLEFVKDDRKKVSFAPSVALDHLSEYQIAAMIGYMSSFRSLSVREQTAIDILQPYCGK